jgi:hypothetical protein
MFILTVEASLFGTVASSFFCLSSDKGWSSTTAPEAAAPDLFSL